MTSLLRSLMLCASVSCLTGMAVAGEHAAVSPGGDHGAPSAAGDHTEPKHRDDHAAPKPDDGHAAAPIGDHAAPAAAADAHAAPKKADHGGAPHWTYVGEHGADHWGEMSQEFAACSKGRVQSPIDIKADTRPGKRDLSAQYGPVPLAVLHNGHTVQFNTDGAGEMMLNGVAFQLLQIHFHTPSEHVFNGQHAPLEAHFVHKSAGGALAVIGVFIVPGAENRALSALISHLPEHETPVKTYAEVEIDPADLLPPERAFTWYLGSLTTPPCTEGVNWHVMAQPITASADQIARLERAMGMNARPVQQVLGRVVVAPQ
jgi:carbonic anhydrase